MRLVVCESVCMIDFLDIPRYLSTSTSFKQIPLSSLKFKLGPTRTPRGFDQVLAALFYLYFYIVACITSQFGFACL